MPAVRLVLYMPRAEPAAVIRIAPVVTAEFALFVTLARLLSNDANSEELADLKPTVKVIPMLRRGTLANKDFTDESAIQTVASHELRLCLMIAVRACREYPAPDNVI
jgi:hypothetical protein